ncbi:MAG: T9SS type A sorting domain-containing protein [Phycisphaerae bacterium]|nr:T9SS type A sorting domain-containing protein [Saprospiraceae bacterium]
MKKTYILPTIASSAKLGFFLLCLMAFTPALFSQKVAHTSINKTNINLRGNPVILGQVTLNTATAGKVILRFDGQCLSSVGDRIVLAASQTTNWGTNDGCVELEAASADISSNPFSHTRSYDVPAGEHTFYAVAQNFYELIGSGKASIYGSLTAEWFPEIPGKAFARHQGFTFENILVEGAPRTFGSLTIDAPESGKVLVRFDGKCVSNYGDLIFFAASNTPTWGNFDGSSSNEVISNDLNHFSFAHIRTYDVEAGSHTFYAVVENFYEVYGNGFASIYGSLTIEFFPDTDGAAFAFQPINTQFGITVEGPPVPVGTINMNAPTAGKVAVNFAGTCIASNGDQVRLAASDHPNWSANDGCIQYEPYSSDHNRTSFSHTMVYDVAPGDHTFYAVIQNYEEYEGSGLAVVYASLTTRFFPNNSSAAQEPEAFRNIKISPNPASEFVHIEYPDLTQERFSMTLCDGNGRILKRFEKSEHDFSEQVQWELNDLPQGVYFIKLTNAEGTAARQFVRL